MALPLLRIAAANGVRRSLAKVELPLFHLDLIAGALAQFLDIVLPDAYGAGRRTNSVVSIREPIASVLLTAFLFVVVAGGLGWGVRTSGSGRFKANPLS